MFYNPLVLQAKSEGGKRRFGMFSLLMTKYRIQNRTCSDNIKHISDEWKGDHSVWAPGEMQEMQTLSDLGVYFYLARSDPKTSPVSSCAFLSNRIVLPLRSGLITRLSSLLQVTTPLYSASVLKRLWDLHLRFSL
jgi:hypothetical protein